MAENRLVQIKMVKMAILGCYRAGIEADDMTSSDGSPAWPMVRPAKINVTNPITLLSSVIARSLQLYNHH